MEADQGNLFLSRLARRVIAVGLAFLLAATFLVAVVASVEQLPIGDTLDAGNPLLRFFPATRANVTDDASTESASTGATAPETTEDPTDEAEDTGPEAVAFVHRANPANTRGNSTYLDDTSTNDDPVAFLSVTQNWNPGGGPGTYNNHPVGVWYDANRSRWAIFNQDLAPVPEGAAFNVVVFSNPAEAG